MKNWKCKLGVHTYGPNKMIKQNDTDIMQIVRECTKCNDIEFIGLQTKILTK